MPKKSGIIFVSLGVVLILSALLLFVYNEIESYNAGQEAETLLNGIQSAISEAKAETNTQEGDDNKMPSIFIDGYEYIGYITIPDLQLELPVMAEWNYERLKVAPGRHFGSTETDDLVIAAHNYKTHFGSVHTLKIGAKIYFTDMDGYKNAYALAKMQTLSADAVDAVKNSGYDLVLYTCTFDGTKRVVAFCERIKAE